MSNFIHLNCHSEYSIVDGILRIKPFVERVAKLGMQAAALTDQSNLFAMVKFYKAALLAGIKPIIGCDVWLDNGEQRLTLLCQNNIGLHNLMQLISKSYNNWQNNRRHALIMDKQKTYSLLSIQFFVKGDRKDLHLP